MRIAPLLIAAATTVSLSAAAAQTLNQTSGPWVLEKSGTTAGLRGIHAVGGGVAWASGTGGTVLRTEDGGYEWQSCALPPGAEKLDFRGIWAWDDNTALVLSSGPGDQSRIYKTTDGCAHWKLLFTNPDREGFWDAMVFESRSRGYLLGDPVNGRFAFYSTRNGGKDWKRSEAAGLEAGSGATGVFAASNSALLGGGTKPMLFGTGGAFIYRRSSSGAVDSTRGLEARHGMSRHRSESLRERWSRIAIPLARGGDAAGVFSIACHKRSTPGSEYTLVAVGGDYKKPDDPTGTAAWSSDGGLHWTASARPPHGYRSAVAWDAAAGAWIAAGPNGSDISRDDGKTWQPLDGVETGGNWNALSLPWVVGAHGRIAKLDPGRLPKNPSR